jgi:type II secretion system protein J/type II secretion system protein I
VALAVLAVALTAGMRAVAQSADAATLLKQRTLALWVAQNRLAAAQLETTWPEPGQRGGTAAQANTHFVWRETISSTPNPAFRKIEIVVAGAGEPGYVLSAAVGLSRADGGMITTRRGGFTLIELLIALAILALVAALGYRALASLTDSEAKLATEAVHWRNLDALFARLEADVRGALPRDVRTDAGTEPAWIGLVDNTGDAEMRFSRAGPEFTLESGSGGQRIGYRLRNGAIEVLYWPYLDQPASVRPQAYALIGNVTRFRVTLSRRARSVARSLARAGRARDSPCDPGRADALGR